MFSFYLFSFFSFSVLPTLRQQIKEKIKQKKNEIAAFGAEKPKDKASLGINKQTNMNRQQTNMNKQQTNMNKQQTNMNTQTICVGIYMIALLDKFVQHFRNEIDGVPTEISTTTLSGGKKEKETNMFISLCFFFLYFH